MGHKSVVFSFAMGVAAVFSGTASACISCPDRLELTEAAATCLLSQMDDLISRAERTDPVFVVLDCGSDAEDNLSDTTRGNYAGRALPRIPLVSGEASDVGAARDPVPYFILSRAQLDCVDRALAAIIDAAPRYPIALDLDTCQSVLADDDG